MRVVYYADDGTEFDNDQDCKMYELEQENCETCKSKDYCGEYQQWLEDNEEAEH